MVAFSLGSSGKAVGHQTARVHSGRFAAISLFGFPVLGFLRGNETFDGNSARMFPKLDLRADIHQAMRFIAGEGTLENP
jgi:hypothetical protein